jgi:GntR family transcriptional regulator / MocR family aminotransferase
MTAQIEDQLREAIRSGTLHAGARLPSTRDLARQLGVSRGVVVSAYAQLGAEGYLAARQGSRPRVSEAAALSVASETPAAAVARPSIDFRLGRPDVSAFPRAAWLRSMRHALAAMPDRDLDYGDPRGVKPLRSALAEYLGRVRGVVAEPGRTVVTTGYSQGEVIVCRALAAAGAKRIGVEDPGHPEQRRIAARAGLEVVPIEVDELGIRVDYLDRTGVEAVIVTPAHQFPTGAVLAAERRTALLAWLRTTDGIAIEDDYDAEYRYDRAPVGALQGLEPDRVVYAGSASKTLAPGLRMGWLVVPAHMLEAITEEKRLADLSTAHVEQHALADFLARGELDRHLRRMRGVYSRRRDALVEALTEELPESVVEGIAAGLHAVVRLPDGRDEQEIREHARRRGVGLPVMSDFRVGSQDAPPMLLLGYSHLPEATIPRGVGALAEAVRASNR